jgi:hypothetical protein
VINFIDYDTLVKIGWTALLGWNLKETVALGKSVVRLQEKLENGVTHDLKDLKRLVLGSSYQQTNDSVAVAAKKKKSVGER